MPDSQTLLLIAAAMVAGIVLFRLYMILGRRTGAEPAPAPPRAVAAPPAIEPPASAGAGGLVDIQLADRDFDTEAFLKGARKAYETIIRAFEAGDRAALTPLLSPEVRAAFDREIDARKPASQGGHAASFLRLDDAKIVGATLEGRHAEITLSFTAAFAGDDGARSVNDVWTFARDLSAADPNWTLVATSGELP
jgi:predicted lipid-binding transport protein (Tim44 family)